MEEKIELFLPDLNAMRTFGEVLAAAGQKGLTLCLDGDLGAGKTTLVQGIAAALGCQDATSPTFNLLNIYEGKKTIYHFDLYRLEAEDELYEAGFYEYSIEDGDFVLIEWGSKFPDSMPQDHIAIVLSRQGKGRHASVYLSGRKYLSIYKEIEKRCQSSPSIHRQ